MKTRQVDSEYASRARQIAHVELSPVNLDGTSGNCQPESKPCPIRRSLRERMKQLFRLSRREAAAFIGDVDQNAIAFRVGLQGDIASGPSELECILQQVGNRRSKHVPIRFNRDAVADTGHGEIRNRGPALPLR